MPGIIDGVDICIRTQCPSCKGTRGEAYECDAPKGHHSVKQCRVCSGYGTLIKWVKLADLAAVHSKQAPHSKVIIERREPITLWPES